MSKRRAEPAADALFADPADRKRRVELAVDRAIRAAQRTDAVDAQLDAGAAALARELARAVDVAGLKRDVWAVAQAGRQLGEQLQRLGLDPKSRLGGTTDAVADALRELAQATRDDPPEGTP